MTIEQALSAHIKPGKPAGALQCICLNLTAEGWQAIASFVSVEKWNVRTGPDALACVGDVLSGNCETFDPGVGMHNIKPSFGLPARTEPPKPAAVDVFE